MLGDKEQPCQPRRHITVRLDLRLDQKTRSDGLGVSLRRKRHTVALIRSK